MSASPRFLGLLWILVSVWPLAAACGPGTLVEDAPGTLAAIVPEGARLRKLAGGMRLTEGPVWTPAEGGRLVFSDVNGDRLHAWSVSRGLSLLRAPAGIPNGNGLDREGRLLTCEHGGRRIARTALDGTLETVVERFQGTRLHSPNDLVVRSDGSIWFTDPPYGLRNMSQRERETNDVFRCDPSTGTLVSIAADFDRPNGIAFAPDERTLYVGDSGHPAHVRAFDVAADGSVSAGVVFCRPAGGAPDGLFCDADGRLWVCVAEGVEIYHPDGTRLGRLRVPETTRDGCFGGTNGTTLFLTAGGSLYALETLVRAPGG